MHAWLGNLFPNLVMYYAIFHFMGYCWTYVFGLLCTYGSNHVTVCFWKIEQIFFPFDILSQVHLGEWGFTLALPKPRSYPKMGKMISLNSAFHLCKDGVQLWKMLWVSICELLLLVLAFCVAVPGLVSITCIRRWAMASDSDLAIQLIKYNLESNLCAKSLIT